MVHVPVIVPPETIPFNRIFVTDEQTVVSVPALTIVGGVIVNVNESDNGRHEFSGVSIKYTPPPEISAALGLYTGFKTESDGVNIPVPFVVQYPNPEPPVTVPAN